MLSLLLLLLGLIFGSFLNVLIYRILKGLSLFGRSFCPRCKTKISWYDNIPLLSFLILGGKCRHCHKNISIQYPVVEVISGISFVIIGLNLPWLALFCILLAILVIDLKHQVIPDVLIFVGLPFSLLLFQDSPFTYILAGFLAASLLMLIHILTGGRGMGLGDVKFAVLGGFLVGIKIIFLWLFLAFLTGAIVSIILVLWKKKVLKDKIAFGPFLVIAIPLSLLLNSSSLLQLWPFFLYFR